MINFDYETLEKKFRELPENLQVIMASNQVSEDIKILADENGLMLDQTSILFNLTSYVILGLLPSNEFIKTLEKEASLDHAIAEKIAQGINEKIFASIRNKLREAKEEQPADQIDRSKEIGELEKAGGFNVLKESPESPERGLEGKDRNRIIEAIENPTTSADYERGDQTYTEPLSDHLLKSSFEKEDEKKAEESSGLTEPEAPESKESEPEAPANLPVSTTEEVKRSETPVEPTKDDAAPTKPPEPTKPRGSDMYREPLD